MRTRVGYAGGARPDPTYRDLGDHTEAFQLDFDPAVLSYDALLDAFWASHDPERAARSRQYMAAVFASPAQFEAALASRERAAAGGALIVTPVITNARFYLAEDYHQKYHLRHDATLMAELAGYDDRALRDSTVAARLNGYVAGHGSRAQLDAELDAMGLSADGGGYLRALVDQRGA